MVRIAEGLLEPAGGEWPPHDAPSAKTTLPALPAASVDERRATGRAMSLKDAVAYALDDAWPSRP